MSPTNLAIDTREQLITVIENSIAIRNKVSDTVSDIWPQYAPEVREGAPDYDTMSDEELIAYIERGSNALRVWIEEIVNTVGPKLSTPVAKLALKSVMGMFS